MDRTGGFQKSNISFIIQAAISVMVFQDTLCAHSSNVRTVPDEINDGFC
jgi:hypothetical protein